MLRHDWGGGDVRACARSRWEARHAAPLDKPLFSTPPPRAPSGARNSHGLSPDLERHSAGHYQRA
eukprot:9705-Chlamydomonas_euryale.AAC.1